MEKPRAVVLLSGGMDSATLLYEVCSQGYEPWALSVFYGQRHVVELDYARELAKLKGAEHKVLDLSHVKELLAVGSLTGTASVPEGHYAADNMAQTVVPNRNAILLALAYGWALKLKAKIVGTAVHKGDWAQYPDCRPEFVVAFEAMERWAITRETYGVSAPRLYAPFVMQTKDEIAAHGQSLGVPWEKTWSCYNGETLHCSRCGTCVERIMAFNRVGIVDPTEYADKDYAIRVLKDAGEWIERTGESTIPQRVY